MELVQNYFGHERGEGMIQLIIGIAKNMDVNVTAEGVEKKEQLDMLKNAGCDFVQGFYFSRPLEVSAFEALLQKDVK